MNRQKEWLWAVCLCLLPLCGAYAQGTAWLLKGKVIGKEGGEPIAEATLQLFSLPDTVFVDGMVSEADGSFAMRVSRQGSYVLKVSYIGLKERMIPVTSPSKGGAADVGSVAMEADAVMLAEAVITAEAPPVQVVEDTVVYNTAAYKVTEGAVLEELVEKLPGAEVDDDGKIKINGQELKKIMVDGKEFFGGDLKTGLQNLPVEMIEQLKTYNKESDMERMTGIDDGEDELVLDVKFKKGRNKGWFGNANVAGGTEDRYSGKLMVNHFTDDSRYSLVASANNVADKNFSSGAKANWKQNRGLTSAQNVGVNLVLDREKFDLDGSLQFVNSDNQVNSNSASERFYSSKSTFSNTLSGTESGDASFRSSFRLEWKPNDKTTLLIRPNLTLGWTDNAQLSHSSSYNRDPLTLVDHMDDYIGPDAPANEALDSVRINSTGNSSWTDAGRWSGSVSMTLNRRLNDRGRNVGLRLGLGGGSSDNDRLRDNLTRYHRMTGADGQDSVNVRRQYIATVGDNWNYSAQFTYSEPLAQAVFLQFSYQFLYKNTLSDKRTYDFASYDGWMPGEPLPQGHETHLIDSLGKKAQYHYYNHDVSVTMRIVRPKYRFSVGVTLQPQRSRLDYTKAEVRVDTVRHVLNVAPKIDFRYKFSKVSQIQLKYSGKSSQPGMEALLPIADNSNPLNIRVGNPGLLPAFTHAVRLNMNTYDPDWQRSVIVNGNLSLVQNSISTSTVYNEETGGRITTSKNINGDWSGSLSVGFNTALRNKKFTIHANTSASFKNNVGYLYDSSTRKEDKNTVTNTRLGGRLSGAYRNEWLELSANGAMNYTFEKNLLRPQNNQEPYSYSYGMALTLHLPWQVSVVTNLVNQARRGYADANFNKDELIWDAQVSKTFWRGNATVSVEAFDLLRQKSNLARGLSTSSRSVTQYNGINSYVMAHFIYRLNRVGGKRVDGMKAGKGWGKAGGKARRR